MNYPTWFVRIIVLFTVLTSLLTFVNGAYEYDPEINCYTITKKVKPFEGFYVGDYTNAIEEKFFKQEYDSIECSRKGEHCFEGVKYDKEDFNATCVTSYIEVELVLGDPDPNGTPGYRPEKKVPIGVGCSCKLLNKKH